MVSTMAKKKNVEQKKRVSLNVAPEDAMTINNLATLRGMSVEEFFMEPDVRQFWAHLSAKEAAKEQARQEDLLRKAQKQS